MFRASFSQNSSVAFLAEKYGPPPPFGTLLAITDGLVFFSSIYNSDSHAGFLLLYFSRTPEPALKNAGTLLQIRIRRVFCGRLSIFIRCRSDRFWGRPFLNAGSGATAGNWRKHGPEYFVRMRKTMFRMVV
jgi:hypothetical protein